MAPSPETGFDPAALHPGGDVSRETLAAFEVYESTLKTWQKAVNLVGSATLDDVWQRHFVDSAQLVPHIPARTDGGPPVILDIGSGAGFPGMVLAILAATGAVPAPGYEVHLVEANARKCAFLKEVARRTGARVAVRQCRVESLAPFPVDVITARGCAPLPRLLDLVDEFLEYPNIFPICLLLKGKTAREELTLALKKWKMIPEFFTSMTRAEGVVLLLKDIVREQSRCRDPRSRQA